MRTSFHVRYFFPILLVGVLAFTSSDIRAAIDRGNARHLAERITAHHCGGECHTCGFMLRETHLFSGGSGSHWDYPYGCVDVVCPNGCHGEAPGGGGDEPLEEVLVKAADAIARDDVAVVRQLLTADKRLFVNYERGVLQAKGCSEEKIVATVALSDVMLASAGIGTE